MLSLGQSVSLWSGTIFIGLAVACLVHWFTQLVTRRIRRIAASWEYDETRLHRIREADTLFRWFEPLIKEIEAQLGPKPPIISSKKYEQICLALSRGGHKLPFEPSEFVAYTFFQGLLGATVLLPIAWHYLSMGALAIVLMVIPMISVWMGVGQLNKAANKRLKDLKRKLPYSIDLISLMMKAGATFPKSLETAVRESEGSAVGEELATIHRLHAGNTSFQDCLQQLRDRMQDQEINEIVLAVQQSMKLGTQLSKTLLNLADQMRLRQSQRLEKEAAEAKAMMTYPQFVMFAACVLIILAPFAIQAFQNRIM